MTVADALDRTLLVARDFVPASMNDAMIVAALRDTRVVIVANERNVATCAGQSAVSTFCALVAQLGCSLRLLLPDQRLVAPQPPLRGDSLLAALVDHAGDLIPDADVRVGGPVTPGELVFVFGDTPWPRATSQEWRVAGTPWSGTIARARASAASWNFDVPFGGLVAATMAAAEPFKHALRVLTGSEDSQLAPEGVGAVRLAADDLAVRGLDLGEIDCISAGAITQAFAHALFRIPEVRAEMRVMDPEKLDLSNLNRYSFGRYSNIGTSKVARVAACAPPSVRVIPIVGRADAISLGALGTLGCQVVVGTDDIASRWEAQRFAPDWLAVGATAKLMAMVTEHGRGDACAGCAHPADDGVNARIATTSFSSYWAGLLLAARLVRHRADHLRRHRAEILWALRPGSRHGRHEYDLSHSPICPLRCAA